MKNTVLVVLITFLWLGNAVAGPPVKLAFTPTSLTFAQATCTASQVNITDNIGKPAPLTAPKTLSINQGPASLLFYSDGICKQNTANFTVPTGASSYVFYMRGSATGAFSIRAQMAGLEIAIQKETITLPVGGGGGPQNPPTSAPAQAVAAGFTNLVFFDEFNPGALSSKWYNTNFFSGSATLPPSGWSIGNGFLSILTDNSGYSDGLATADPNHGTQAWHHGYFESSMRFDPNGFVSGGWPAFWSYSLAAAQGKVPVGNHFGELDFMECYPLHKPCTYITTVHEWQDESSNTTLASNSNNVPSIPANTDFTQWHIYGCLWTTNQVQWYFDNKLVTTVATGPGTSFTGMEADTLMLIIGTGKNWRVDYDFVHVWQ